MKRILEGGASVVPRPWCAACMRMRLGCLVQLFFVVATYAAWISGSVRSFPHFGQRALRVSCALTDIISVKRFPQAGHSYS